MIKSEQDLEKLFGVKNSDLDFLIGLKSQYRQWKEPKKSGGFREISSPPLQLKDFQAKANKILLPLVDTKLAKGGIKRQDRTFVIEKVMKCHKIIKIDIKNCFPSIKGSRVYYKLKEVGFSHKYAKIFAELLTLNNCLPQGSPSSTCLANLVLNDLDKEILTIIPDQEKCFRWVDDVIIALDKKILEEQTDIIAIKLKSIFQSHHFEIKNDVVSVIHREHANDILGLSISRKKNVNKDWYRKFRSQLHHLEQMESPSRKKLNSIKGKFSTLKQVTKKNKKQTRIRKIKQIIDEIEKKIDS